MMVLNSKPPVIYTMKLNLMICNPLSFILVTVHFIPKLCPIFLCIFLFLILLSTWCHLQYNTYWPSV